ncbi:MerR family transcriptional regulator [Halotia wernerae UHCC 0503]|nr:MerR family transcriptional regulator [Halotia wernerae UHCC 0503]
MLLWHYFWRYSHCDFAKICKNIDLNILLRRWESEGRLIPERTTSGHRRYDLAQLLGVK